jgi:Na+/melibiose symporter-like transporter
MKERTLLALVALIYLVDGFYHQRYVLTLISFASICICLFYLLMVKRRGKKRDYYICLSIAALPSAIYESFTFHNFDGFIFYLIVMAVGAGLTF